MSIDKTKILPSRDNKLIAKIVVLTAIFIMVAHVIYMNVMGVREQDRTTCFIYSSMPRWIFYIYECFFDFVIVVLLGVFAGVLIELNLKKAKRFFPKNQLLAFVYGAILPVCSCGVLPLIETMKNRVSLKVIVTFIIAAPLLNPYIVFVSFTVLGVKYGLLRILSSFILAIASGFMVELIANRYKMVHFGKYESCVTDCSPADRDPFVRTLRITQKLIPYIIIGGAMSFALEYMNPKQYLDSLSFSNNWLSMAIMMVIGIPLYVCNGADVLLLKPLLTYTDLSLGAAMTFSLSSSVVCVSSIVMLIKFLGKKLTFLLLANIIVIIFLLGAIISLF